MTLRTWIIAFSLFCAPLGWATSFYIPPFPQTVQSTPVMVRGRVGASRSDWGKGPDGVKRLYTYYDLQVEEVLKGDVAGTELVMRELGGEKDGIGMEVPGASKYQSGEEVVVTLSEANPDGTYDVRNLMMGKFNLKTDESGNDVLVGPGLEQHMGDEAASSGKTKWTLDALRQLIRAQAQGKPFTPVPATGATANTAVSASPSVAPHLLPSPRASVLTEEVPDDESRTPWGWIAIVLAVVGAVGWLVLRTRK